MRLQMQRALPAIALVTLVGLGATPPQDTNQESRLAMLEARFADLESRHDDVLGRLEQLRLDLDNTLDPLRVPRRFRPACRKTASIRAATAA